VSQKQAEVHFRCIESPHGGMTIWQVRPLGRLNERIPRAAIRLVGWGRVIEGVTA